MTRHEHTKAKQGVGRVLANLALGAGLVLAACGTTQALSATNATNETGQISVVRDPDNASWTGARAADGGVSGGRQISVVRDPENPYWTGADATRSVLIDPAAEDQYLRGPR